MQAKPDRRELVDALNRAIREASALGQMFSGAVAAKVGLGGADLEYLDILSLHGRMTAGELAAATGLTTGAITGVVDRLERAGFAERQRDPDDRRRVFVAVRPQALAEAAAHYRSLGAAMDELAAGYSDGQLVFLVEFFARSLAIIRAEIAKAKDEPPPA